MSNEHDEYSGIFDDLTADDFLTPVETNGGTSLPRDASIDFDAFVNAHLRSLRAEYMAVHGDLQPVAHLMTPDAEWMFSPVEDENLGDFVDRLGNEAKRLGAAWVFLSRRTLVGTWQASPDEVPDSNDPASIQAAIEAGTYREGVFYFGQRGSGEHATTRHGIIYIEGDTLGEPIEGDATQGIAFFMQILDGKS